MKQKDWVKIFKAFGNEKRLNILKLLWPDGELPVVEIGHKIRLSIKSTSKHLALLKNVGLIEGEGKKNSVYYRINPDLSYDIKNTLKDAMR